MALGSCHKTVADDIITVIIIGVSSRRLDNGSTLRCDLCSSHSLPGTRLPHQSKPNKLCLHVFCNVLSCPCLNDWNQIKKKFYRVVVDHVWLYIDLSNLSYFFSIYLFFSLPLSLLWVSHLLWVARLLNWRFYFFLLEEIQYRLQYRQLRLL